MGSKGNDSKRSKPMRRRSQTRRLLQDCVINMADARREVVQALQIHRSSSTRTATASATSATMAAACSTTSAKYCYYSLTESMPVPDPIWSTTAPTILPAAPSVAAAAAMESLEFEWGEIQEAAAYNWWLGFLKTLDSKKNKDVEDYSKYPHSRVFGYQDNLKLGEGKFVDAASDQQNSADEWLMFPTSDDEQGDQTTTDPLD